jgi:hypothetical protein
MGVGRKEREDTVRAAATRRWEESWTWVARAAPRPEEQPVMNQTDESSIVVTGDIAGKISGS